MSWPAKAAVVAVLAACGLLGCLRAFGPDLRPVGVHAGARPGHARDECMSCHESEADALARMQAHGRAHASDAPLVADWMLAESRACTVCHAVRHAVRGSSAR